MYFMYMGVSLAFMSIHQKTASDSMRLQLDLWKLGTELRTSALNLSHPSNPMKSNS